MPGRRGYTAWPHSSTHPEGWRDMALRNPGNLPQGNGANSIRLQRQAWEMWTGRFSKTSVPLTPAEVFYMPPEHLAARNVRPDIRSTHATSASAALVRWRSPTAPRGDRSERAATPDPSRPALDLALRRLPAGEHAEVRSAFRMDAPRSAPTGSHASSGSASFGQERRRQPDALVQGPRRLGRARPGSGARFHDDRLRLDGQPRQRRRGARGGGGLSPMCSCPPTWRSRRSSPPACTERTWYGARELRRRQPSVHRDLRRA